MIIEYLFMSSSIRRMGEWRMDGVNNRTCNCGSLGRAYKQCSLDLDVDVDGEWRDVETPTTSPLLYPCILSILPAY